MKSISKAMKVTALLVVACEILIGSINILACDCTDVQGVTSHNCRLYGIISNNLTDNLLLYHLKYDFNSFEKQSYNQVDGWGIVYYPSYGDTPVMERGAIRAWNDPRYTTVVSQINSSEPQIILAHIRTCVTGCCEHGRDSVPDPHPFYRLKNGKTWTFAHNGVVDKNRVTNRINLNDPSYLNENPPNGSGIPQCNPNDPDLVVDSELYFLLLLQQIEENNWNVDNGLVSAINQLLSDGETGAMNFVLSDGIKIWAFRKESLSSSSHTLYYIYDWFLGYSAVASEPITQENWIAINDYQLVVLSGVDEPVIIDVLSYQGDLLVDSDFDGSIDSADLRANSIGQDWYESTQDNPNLVTLNFTNIGGNNTTKASFTASNTQNAYLTQEFSQPITQTCSIQWDIYVNSILNLSSDPDRAAWMLIGDDTSANPNRIGPNAEDSERFVYLGFYKNGGGSSGTMDLVARDRNDTWENFTTVASGLNIKQWYTIKVCLNLVTDTYDVYVDNEYKATLTSRNAKNSVTHISFAQWNDGAGSFYVDNVTAEPLLLTDSQLNDSIDSADLRANSAGQDWYESRQDNPNLVTLNVTNIGGNNTAKASFTASNTHNAYLTQEFSQPITQTCTIQWDIYVNSILNLSSDPDRAAWMLIGDDTGTAPDRTGPNAEDSERFVYLGFYKNGGGSSGTMNLVARDRNDSWDNFTTVASGLNMKQWYTIKVCLNLVTDTYEVYVDNEYKATVTSRNAKDSVTHISFAQWDDGAGSFYVDNVTAEPLDTPNANNAVTKGYYFVQQVNGDVVSEYGAISTAREADSIATVLNKHLVSGVEYSSLWFHQDNISGCIAVAKILQLHGIDLWLSSGSLEARIPGLNNDNFPSQYRACSIDADGSIIPAKVWCLAQPDKIPAFDWMNPEAMNWFLDRYKQIYLEPMKPYTSGYFFNEDCLYYAMDPGYQVNSRIDYWELPAYSDPVLRLWQEYCIDHSVTYNGNVVSKFPVNSPAMVPKGDGKTEYYPGYNVPEIVESGTALVSLPRNTGVWAAWDDFVTSQYVESCIGGIAKAVYEVNRGNPNFKGVIYFGAHTWSLAYEEVVDPSFIVDSYHKWVPWGTQRGVRLSKICALPYVDYIICETYPPIQSNLYKFMSTYKRIIEDHNKTFGLMLHRDDNWGLDGRDKESDRWEAIQYFQPTIITRYPIDRLFPTDQYYDEQKEMLFDERLLMYRQ